MSYRLLYTVIASIAFSAVYFLPVLTPLEKGFVFFSGLAVLMEFWEIELPKFPKILVADTIYTASLFFFPLPFVIGLIAIGGLGRALFFLKFGMSDLFCLIRRVILFGLSVPIFERVGLVGAFSSLRGQAVFEQVRIVGAQLGIFA